MTRTCSSVDVVSRPSPNPYSLLAVAALLLIGCGGGAGASPAVPAFEGEPGQAVVSDSGALSIGIRWSPDPPVVGLVAAELTTVDVRDAAQEPASGLSLAVVPWMPSHGHGTSVVPAVEETAPGIYVVTRLNLFMPGEWQLRTTISGPIDDAVNPTIEVH
jgi:hypothetical protein